MAALSSCRKDDPYYPPQEPATTQSPELKTVLITVKSNQWVYSNTKDGLNNYFYATVDMPEITQDVFKTGLIKMYRVWDWGSSSAVQMEMPFSRHNEEYWEDSETDEYGWNFYTESLDYEFGVGTMTICYTLSDFYYEIDEDYVPDQMQFRCVIME